MSAPSDVKQYLIQQLQNIVLSRDMQEAIYSNLYVETRDVRYQRIIDGIEQIVNQI